MCELITERLILRTMSQEDADALFHIWSNEKITEFMNILPMTNVEQALEMIQLFDNLSDSNQGCRYSIFHHSSGELIGSCGFNDLDFVNDRGEIGYELSDLHWNKGYMSESLSALTAHGFDHLGLNRIEAKVEPRNIASQALLKKQGFTKEGLLRNYEKAKGSYINLEMYSLLKDDAGHR